MTNAACLLCARPCAKAPCCPTTHRAGHPDAILGLRLRQRGRQWPAWSRSAKWWGCSGHPIPKPRATSVLLGLRGSASSRGREGVYTRKRHDRKPPPSYRRSKGEGVDSGHEADRLLRCSIFSAATLFHLTNGSSVLLQVTFHKAVAFQNRRVKSTWDRWSAANQKYLFPTTPPSSSTAFITSIRSASLQVLFALWMVSSRMNDTYSNSSLHIPRMWTGWQCFLNGAPASPPMIFLSSHHGWWSQELRWPALILLDHLAYGVTWW